MRRAFVPRMKLGSLWKEVDCSRQFYRRSEMSHQKKDLMKQVMPLTEWRSVYAAGGTRALRVMGVATLEEPEPELLRENSSRE